jgi:hypothetical protein
MEITQKWSSGCIEPRALVIPAAASKKPKAPVII